MESWIFRGKTGFGGTRAGRDSGGAFLQKNMGWDSQAVVKRSDHAEAEWAFVIEDFGDAVFPGEVFCEVFLSQTLLLHAEADGFDGV